MVHSIRAGLVLACLLAASAARGQGIIVPSAGPINSAMAGASTAAPVDFGSSYWNPATLSGLDKQEVLLGSALLFPSGHFATRLPAGSINGQFPPNNRFGTARSDSGVASGLATGAAIRLADDSPVTIGLGIFGLVGGGVNFPGSTATPVLSPRQPPRFFGFGPIFASMSLLTINPMVSLEVTDRLYLAGGPVISAGTASFSPAFFAPGPKDAYGLNTFPAATNARPFWGGGFQLGLLFLATDDWSLGFSYKSPVWQERWSFNASTPDLAPRRIGIQAQIPAIYSWGLAYKGLPKTLLDVDLRYFDYANTALFGQKVVDGGLGWHSVFAVALGGQYRATDRLTLRAGYLYNANPIPATNTLFNVQAPAIIQNTLTMGGSFQITENVTLSLAWMHGFRNSIEGTVLQERGISTRLDAQLDTLWTGLNITFGGSKRPLPGPVPAVAPPAPAAPVADGAAPPSMPG
jgi:long-chain fatty acid transport protein